MDSILRALEALEAQSASMTRSRVALRSEIEAHAAAATTRRSDDDTAPRVGGMRSSPMALPSLPPTREGATNTYALGSRRAAEPVSASVWQPSVAEGASKGERAPQPAHTIQPTVRAAPTASIAASDSGRAPNAVVALAPQQALTVTQAPAVQRPKPRVMSMDMLATSQVREQRGIDSLRPTSPLPRGKDAASEPRNDGGLSAGRASVAASCAPPPGTIELGQSHGGSRLLPQQPSSQAASLRTQSWTSPAPKPSSNKAVTFASPGPLSPALVLSDHQTERASAGLERLDAIMRDALAMTANLAASSSQVRASMNHLVPSTNRVATSDGEPHSNELPHQAAAVAASMHRPDPWAYPTANAHEAYATSAATPHVPPTAASYAQSLTSACAQPLGAVPLPPSTSSAVGEGGSSSSMRRRPSLPTDANASLVDWLNDDASVASTASVRSATSFAARQAASAYGALPGSSVAMADLIPALAAAHGGAPAAQPAPSVQQQEARAGAYAYAPPAGAPNAASTLLNASMDVGTAAIQSLMSALQQLGHVVPPQADTTHTSV